MSKKVALGGDHAGYEYKKSLKDVLEQASFEVKDFGPFTPEPVDYPDYVHPLANAIESGEQDFGILVCGSGNGVAIAANKHRGVRAALCWNLETVKLSREHNNANVLCIPARFVSQEMANEMVRLFLETKFEGGRHQTRVDKIPLC